MNVKYIIKLTADEREQCERIVHTGKSAAWKIQRAHALLLCDRSETGPAWNDEQVACALDVTTRTVQTWRKRAVEEGPEGLLKRQWPPRPKAVKLDGQGQARLVQLACSAAPDGRVSWTLSMLADKLVELNIVDSISHETVRQALKKTISSRG